MPCFFISADPFRHIGPSVPPGPRADPKRARVGNDHPSATTRFRFDPARSCPQATNGRALEFSVVRRQKKSTKNEVRRFWTLWGSVGIVTSAFPIVLFHPLGLLRSGMSNDSGRETRRTCRWVVSEGCTRPQKWQVGEGRSWPGPPPRVWTPNQFQGERIKQHWHGTKLGEEAAGRVIKLDEPVVFKAIPICLEAPPLISGV